jgi:hypothetical protein
LEIEETDVGQDIPAIGNEDQVDDVGQGVVWVEHFDVTDVVGQDEGHAPVHSVEEVG